MRSSIYGISHHTLRHNVLYLNQAWNATRGMLIIYGQVVQGHVSEKSFSWAFYEHWSFFAETYRLNGAVWKKSCLQFFQSHLGLFYAN